jgi:REP element-mobilizing transposase RayT
MPDHLHLLVGLRPDAALSDWVRDIKANSSRFINEKRWVMGRFSWQEGFGAFSYSRSQLGAVICNIENQQKHHANQSFLDEYTAPLNKFEVEYDQRYIFKPIDG